MDGKSSSVSGCVATIEKICISHKLSLLFNVYGPHGTFEGGREKAPASICRNNHAKFSGINQYAIWGDGEQTRSFMYIDDCLEGTQRLLILKNLSLQYWER